MEVVNIGIIGFGTVGSGVVKLLKKNASLIKKRTGMEIKIKKIADLDTERDRDIKVDRKIITEYAEEIIHDVHIQIVVELIGGIHPAKDYIIESLKRGKAVVTANKALLAEAGEEIFRVAVENNQDIYFEASVCGGVPVIKTIREGTIANRIRYLSGIINGTANYILSKMDGEGLTFKDALEDAQKRGFAEADPALDIEGIDSAHKLIILGSLIFGIPLKLNDVYVEGISSLSPLDLRFAQEFGYTVKLLAVAKEVSRKLQFRVHPALINRNHPLASVKEVYNAVYMEGDAIGKLLLYGKGAGQMPTASAVVTDIVDIMRNLRFKMPQRIPPITYSAKKRCDITPMDSLRCAFYLRIMAVDKPGVLAQISRILGEHNISIASVVQKDRRKHGAVPIVMMTHEAVEKDTTSAIRKIDNLSVVREKTVRIRVEE
ncbi:MAG TPA: homoserine dehydrogenase [Candidatus Omnitrophica bacterium]|nr:homoserine dehydrogenase [Candidatus Omnitrophota bacterium]